MLNPIRVRRAVFIRASPAEVWRLCENPGSAFGVLPKGATMELLTDRFDEVGSRWRIVTGHGRNRMVAENEVVEIEPLRRQVLRSRAGRMEGTSVTTLTPRDGGTVLLVEATAVFPPGLRTIPDRLLTAIIGPIATGRALKKMARLVERGAR